MKNRIKLSVGLLLLSSVIVFFIIIYLILSTLKLQQNKFKYSTEYLSSTEFYQYRINYDELAHLSNTLLKEKKAWKETGREITDYKSIITDTLKSAFRDFKNVQADLKKSFLAHDIDISFKTTISLSQYIIFDEEQTYPLTDSEGPDHIPLRLFGDTSLTPLPAATHNLFFRGPNYAFQINLHISYDSILLYFLKDIKYVLAGAFIVFIIFALILFYTIRTIYKQEELSEMKNDFINNITHELQTPITTIAIATKTLKNPLVLSTKDQAINLIHSIENQSKRLATLVEKVLNLSLLRKKGIKLSLQRINIHELLDKIIQGYHIREHIESFHIKTNFTISHPSINVDSFYFEMAISNIIDNAIKYTLQHKDIFIETYETKRCMAITVKDEGLGIPKKRLKHIFKKFYRVPMGNIHTIKGTGLGLYYVYLIVKAHEGKIKVLSKLHKGTMFTIYLPKK